MRAILDHTEQLTPDITTFWFKSDSTFDYTAGQFIELTLDHPSPDSRGVKRWFTLSSSPTESLLSITTRHPSPSSTFKKKLFTLNSGDSVEISQAMGDFVLPIQQQIPLLFIVAGIGATPVRSIITSLVELHQQRPVDILHVARSPENFIFSTLFAAYAARYKAVDLNEVSDTQLRTKIIDAATVAHNSRIYISGPEAFTEETYKLLIQAKVPASRIITDYFHGYNAM